MPRQSYSAFARELAKQDKIMAQRLLELVAQITSEAQIRALDDAIEARDFARVYEILRLDRRFWAPLDRQIQEAFTAGALWQQSMFPRGLGLRIEFDHRNPRAESWYMRHGAKLVTEVTDDQRAMVRIAVLQGLEEGRGVAALRKDLIGTKEGNQRKGGIVGLHSRQASAVARMRGYLGDPDTMGEYFQRTARDRRYDRTVAKAIREGRALTAAQIEKITRAYAQRLLVVRSDRIARTEMHNAFSAGAYEGIQQVMEANDIPADAITLEWQATIGSLRTRDTHRAMHEQRIKMGEAFVSPSGARLKYPGDDSLGAPAEELISCRCSALPRISFERLAR